MPRATRLGSVALVSEDRIAWARAVAERFMPPLGRRWAHVQSVASLAASLPFDGEEHSRLVAAAYLHDIGYSPELATTGFHPLDGARHLRSVGQEDLARLVAHHTNARYEAQLRGLEGYQDEFPFEDTILDTALTFCDLSTSPDGEPVTLDERVTELVDRYGRDNVTAKAVLVGMPDFAHGCDQIRELCAEAGVSVQRIAGA